MIEVKKLAKKYGDYTAVYDVSFSAAKGEIVGFLGPNGAGKTTTTSDLFALFFDLLSKLTSWSQDNSKSGRVSNKFMKYRQSKGCCFAGTGVGDTYNVAPSQTVRDSLVLDW